MRASIVLDKDTKTELNELASMEKTSKSNLVRKAVKDLYLKEKRARENLLFFVDLYRTDIITKDMLFLLLPREDAEAVIIGAKIGKEGANIVKNYS